MPIPRRLFDLGINEEIEKWMRKIDVFLSARKEEAFYRDELWKLIYGKPSWTTSEKVAFDVALEKLLEVGKLEKRSIQGVDYYGYKKLIKKRGSDF